MDNGETHGAVKVSIQSVAAAAGELKFAAFSWQRRRLSRTSDRYRGRVENVWKLGYVQRLIVHVILLYLLWRACATFATAAAY